LRAGRVELVRGVGWRWGGRELGSWRRRRSGDRGRLVLRGGRRWRRGRCRLRGRIVRGLLDELLALRGTCGLTVVGQLVERSPAAGERRGRCRHRSDLLARCELSCGVEAL